MDKAAKYLNDPKVEVALFITMVVLAIPAIAFSAFVISRIITTIF